MVKVLEILKNEFPELEGVISIELTGGLAIVSGSIRGARIASVIKKIETLYPGRMIVSELEEPETLTVVITGEERFSEVFSTEELPLDEVRILYQGLLPTRIIKDTVSYKFGKQENPDRMKPAIDVLEFLSPLVLDQNLEVIDGHMRLVAARLNDREKVPVIIVEVDEVKKDFLRLVLNRSGEFQRWAYDEVDVFVDSNPQLQPVLEPLGFFGQSVLPETFFSNAVIQYKIDPFDTQQSFYRQETSLADWAESRRAEILEADERRKASRKKKSEEGLVSLFDLEVKDEDLLPTYDPKFEMEQHVLKTRDFAGDLTDDYDKHRKEILEAKGESFHKTRILASEVADNNRRLFTEYIKSFEFDEEDEMFLKEAAEGAENFRAILDEVAVLAQEFNKDYISFAQWKKDNK